MKIRENEKSEKQNKEILPITSIRRFFIIFGVCSVITIFIGGAVLKYQQMQQSANAAYQSASTQISQKIDETVKLLSSLASLPEYYDPSIPWTEKVTKIDKINETFGYMFICFVDTDMLVYTIGEEPASLASREHMQKAYSTKEVVVTDSFIAGADGKTLNYTVVVPMLVDGEVTGFLFSTIYFDDIVELLNDATSSNQAGATLIGSKGLIMSSTEGLSYGTAYTKVFESSTSFSMTKDKLETILLARKSGTYQSIKAGNLVYTKYGPVKNTNWDILVSVDFFTLFSSTISYLTALSSFAIIIIFALYLFVRRHIMKQAEITKDIISSIHKMEKELHPNNHMQNVDYENIIQLTGKGLKDALTGAATRVFFLNQAEQLLEEEDKPTLLALCFIDLDDLKTLNDTHGHLAGDIALKKIGTILREYEKKYDGIVGRYGGDEFILILKDIDSLEELTFILEELLNRLVFHIDVNDEEIIVHSSIGASVRRSNETLDILISNADKALYDVKRHGKGAYSLFLDGGVQEL